MSHSAFPTGNKKEIIDAMIDYVTFIRNIAAHQEIPGAVLTLSQTIDELKLEQERRVENSSEHLRETG